MAFYLSYDRSLIGGGPGDDLIAFARPITPMPGMEVTELWDDDLIDAGAGNDTINASLGEDTIIGGPGDDLISGGTGNPFPTGPGADTFVYNFAAVVPPGAAVAPFRNGRHPNDHANGRAWENYAEHAQKKGFDLVVGETAGGRPLYGKSASAPDWQPLDGHDTITDFRADTGDRILIQGVADAAEAAFLSRLSFSGETLFYGSTPIITLAGVQSFSTDWVTFA